MARGGFAINANEMYERGWRLRAKSEERLVNRLKREKTKSTRGNRMQSEIKSSRRIRFPSVYSRRRKRRTIFIFSLPLGLVIASLSV